MQQRKSCDLNSRVERETKAYDEGSCDRRFLSAALAHTNGGPARLRRERFIKEALAYADGRDVLEIGCKTWATHLPKNNIQPRSLICINISARELGKGKELSKTRNFDVSFQRMDAHRLAFRDNTFDVVFGGAILHHLVLETAIKEIARVLKPNGLMLFTEPLGLNPVAKLVRAVTPHARTKDERALSVSDLRLIDRYFLTKKVYTELFSVPLSVLSAAMFQTPRNPLMRFGDLLDHVVLTSIPFLNLFYRIVVIMGSKRPFLYVR